MAANIYSLNRHTFGQVPAVSPCRQCHNLGLCLLPGLPAPAFDEISPFIRHPRPLHKDEKLFCQGQNCSAFYLVQSGSFKTSVTDEDGKYWVTGFHFPGGMLGFDALESRHYPCEASAMETATVCALPGNLFESVSLATCQTVLGSVLKNLIAAHKAEYDYLLHLLKMPARQKLASFLLHMSRYMQQCGKSDREFDLCMRQQDIADYLGLAPETLSRLLHGFQNEGMVSACKKHLVIHDMEKLRSVLYRDA